MQEVKFTKGPWIVEYDNSDFSSGGQWYVAGPAKVEFSYGCGPDVSDKALRDAQLISAAPDMYEAAELGLKIAESWIHDQLDGCIGLKAALDELEPIRAALSKARGEQQ